MAVAREMNWTEWEEWVSTRPEVVQDLCRRFPPDRLYRIGDDGSRGTIYSYSENGTITLSVTGQYNRIMFDRNVFGLDPNTLHECDLPGPDEELGAALTEREDIDTYLDMMREKHPGLLLL